MKKKMAKAAWVPAPLYKKILASVPIPCVDIVVSSKRGERGRGAFLLGRRMNKPAQGKWWLIGGRIHKGEHLEDAVRRHVETETGVSKIKVKKKLDARETMFKDSAQGPSCHSINVIFLTEIPNNSVIVPHDSENSDLRWFSKIDPRWDGYVKDMLRAAGFK